MEIFSLDMGQISSNLLKRHLKHDSMPFFPLTLRLATFLLRQPHSQKSKFLLFLFLLFLSFCCSDWPSTGLTTTSKTSVKASLRPAILTMEFALSFSLDFLSSLGIFQSIRPRTLRPSISVKSRDPLKKLAVLLEVEYMSKQGSHVGPGVLIFFSRSLTASPLVFQIMLYMVLYPTIFTASYMCAGYQK